MLKVLVVDDNKDILNIISLFLEDNGFEFVTANDGEEGLRRFNETLFDLVITDLIMPKCNGIELARYVHNSVRKIPVIGLTGAPWEIDLNYFDGIIEKPFSFEDLNECITTVLNAEKREN